jgi:hypothetical protein
VLGFLLAALLGIEARENVTNWAGFTGTPEAGR